MLGNVEVSEIGMGCMGLSHGYGAIPDEDRSVEAIRAAHAVFPLSAVQNIYLMVERGVEGDVIPFCEAHGIGLVAFSPVASGLLSGKVSAATQFEPNDDVRVFVPQLKPENIGANEPIVEMLRAFAEEKGATPAQICLAWMLRRSPCAVPIPGSKNRGRILENLGASEVEFTDDEFARLQAALDSLEVHGHRGYNEAEGRGFLDRK